MPNLKRWIRNHLFAIALMLIVVVLGWAAMMPPHFQSYGDFWQLSLWGFLILGLGLSVAMHILGDGVQILYRIDNSAFYLGNPPTLVYIFSGVLLFLIGLLFGLLIEIILAKRQRRWVRALIIAPLIVNFLAGLIVLIFFFALGGFAGNDDYYTRQLSQRANCEHRLSSLESLRIVKNDFYTLHFVLKLNHQDDSSLQLLHTEDSLGCASIGSLDSEFFWLWTRNSIIVTHDGGKNWQAWDVRADLDLNDPGGRHDALRYSRGSAGRLFVSEVLFENDMQGTATLEDVYVSQPDIQIVLRTADGGLAWQVDNVSSPHSLSETHSSFPTLW